MANPKPAVPAKATPFGRTPNWLAGAWAEESGMSKPFVFGKPDPAPSGGFSVIVSDSKGHSAICTFRADGSRDMYERTDAESR